MIKLDERVLLVLRRVQRMNEHALPKFNWANSALDAESIQLLNDVPTEVQLLIQELEKN